MLSQALDRRRILLHQVKFAMKSQMMMRRALVTAQMDWNAQYAGNLLILLRMCHMSYGVDTQYAKIACWVLSGLL